MTEAVTNYKQAYTILNDGGTNTTAAAANRAFTSTSTSTPSSWCP